MPLKEDMIVIIALMFFRCFKDFNRLRTKSVKSGSAYNLFRPHFDPKIALFVLNVSTLLREKRTGFVLKKTQSLEQVCTALKSVHSTFKDEINGIVYRFKTQYQAILRFKAINGL